MRMKYSETNKKAYAEIVKLFEKFECLTGTTFYFNNQRISYTTETDFKVEQDYKASEYCEGADDNGISIMSEDVLYEILNNYENLGHELKSELEYILRPFKMGFDFLTRWCMTINIQDGWDNVIIYNKD